MKGSPWATRVRASSPWAVSSSSSSPPPHAVSCLRSKAAYRYVHHEVEPHQRRQPSTNGSVSTDRHERWQLAPASLQHPYLHQIRSTTPRFFSSAATATVSETPPHSTESSSPPILWTTHRLNATQIAKVDAIFHKILWLDLFETHMLNDLVNERMGLVLTPKQRHQLSQFMETQASGSGDGRSAAAAAAEPEEVKPILVDLKLTGFDASAKIKVIKEVRSILNLGLKEAKEMVEGAPVILQKGLKPEVAEELKAKLESAGAKVDVQ